LKIVKPGEREGGGRERERARERENFIPLGHLITQVF